MRPLLCYLILFMLSLNSSDAQVVKPSAEELARLDEIVEEHLKSHHIPGGLVALVSKGEILHLQTYGLANVELGAPVTDSTVFEIGSISKQFVVAAAMMLRQEGRLDLDASIHTFLPGLPSEWLGVTVRQLMNHSSGIPDYEEIRSYDVYRFRLTPEEVIKIAHSRPMDFAPGTGYYYSNTGYFILSMIVERVEGKPLNQVLRDRFFDPLEMNQTRLADPEAIIPHRAAGYWVNKRNELINRNPTETSSTLGAGGILTSVYDLAKWDAALNGVAFLNEESKTAMWTPDELPDGTLVGANANRTGYGYGWSILPYKGLTLQQHGGMVAGFRADFRRAPDAGVTAIVFLNRYRVSTSPIPEALLHTFVPSLGPIDEVLN